MKKFKRDNPRISIIIPSWFTPGQNGRWGENETYWFAQECLKRLIQVTPKDLYELIIIDNGSTLELDYNNLPIGYHYSVEDYFKTADIVIRNKENLGFAPAVNQGVFLARGEYIAVINNDILLFTGWIEKMLEIFEKELTPPVGLVMPALVQGLKDPREALKLETVDCTSNAGKYGQGAEFGSLYIFKRSLSDAIRETNKKEFGHDWFLNENFRGFFGEDRWLYRQVRLLGYETYRTHDCRVFHGGNYSVTKVPDRKQFTEPNREYLGGLKKKYNID